MGVAQQFATNKKLEKEGIAITCQANADKTVPTIHVARTFRQSVEYRKVFERISKPWKAEIDADSLDPETDFKIMCSVFVEVSIKGWDNMQLPKGFAGIGLGEGADVPFSIENCMALFTELRDLFTLCAEKSANADAFREGALEVVTKNW
jgi:hypothetical protein